MSDFHKIVLAQLREIREEIAELKSEIKKDRVDSEYCTKNETLEILGWGATPKAGSDKLGILRKHKLLSQPSQAPNMYITKEVYELKKRIETGKVIVQRIHTGYKVTSVK